MTAVTPFQYSGHEVRTVTIDGEPWFVLADLLDVLSIARRPSAVAERLRDGVRQTYPIVDSMGRTQQATIVSEAGMYAVILRSDKPEAGPFQDWVTGEVLPTIRKTGGYGGAKELTGSELMAAALIEAQQVLAAKDRELEAAQPKVEAFDAFMDADGCYSVGNVAKMFGIGQNRLFDDLRAAGVLIAKGAMRNTPYQQYMHHFRVTPHTFPRGDGTTGTSYTTKVRPSGVDFIRRKLGVGQPVAA